MRWCLSTPGSAEYILPITLSTSITPVSPWNRHRFLKMYLIKRVWDALGDGDWMNSEMHMVARIERVWRCTWRTWSCELEGHNRASLKIHLEAVIEQVWKCTWRPRSCELRRCTWRPWSIEFGDALWGWDRASLDMHLQAMIERDWRRTWRRSIWREARWQLRLYSLVNLYLWEGRELSTTSAERWETGWERETVNLGVMLYLVYAVLCVNSWLWHGEIQRDNLTSCS